MTPPPPAAPAPVSPPSGLPLEEGGGTTPFWPVMVGLTCMGMVALAALLLLICAWAKPEHLTVGKVTPTPTAGVPRRPAPTATAAATRPDLPRGSREYSVARPGTFLKRSAPKPLFARSRTVLGSGKRLPQQSCSCRSRSWDGNAGTAGGLRALQMQQECGGSSETLRGSSTGSCCGSTPSGPAKATQRGHPPPPPTPTPPPTLAVPELGPRDFSIEGAPSGSGRLHTPRRGRSRHWALSHTASVVLEQAASNVVVLHRPTTARYHRPTTALGPQAFDPFAVLEEALVGAAMLSGVGALLPTDAEMHLPPALTAERGPGSHRSAGAERGPVSQRTDASDAPAERRPRSQRVGAAAPVNWWEKPDWWVPPGSSHQGLDQDTAGGAAAAPVAAPTISAVAVLTATTKAVPGTATGLAEAAGGVAGGGQTAWTTLRRGKPDDRLFATRLAMLASKEEGRRTRRGCVK